MAGKKEIIKVSNNREAKVPKHVKERLKHFFNIIIYDFFLKYFIELTLSVNMTPHFHI